MINKVFISRDVEMNKKLSPLQRYQRDLKELKFIHDQAQYQAVIKLDDLYSRFENMRIKKNTTLFKIKNFLKKDKMPVISGLYIWGGVGRGKTYLMDIFFDVLPTKAKKRIHFHRFMREVHSDLSKLESKKNPLKIIANNISKNIEVICFDEFFVNDIGDAMVLAGIFRELFKDGVCLVATSNVHPDSLYNEGLQRQRFIPAINLIKKYTEIYHLYGDKDYRLKTLEETKLFHYPLNSESDQLLIDTLDKLIPYGGNLLHCPKKNNSITIESRKIPVRYVFDDLVWFNFFDLCDGPRSQNDYIEVAKEFHTVILSGIPKFGDQDDDLARRFIYLIDIFYDRKIKLILSSEVVINDLYTHGKLLFEFERTISRLQEMQSSEYLAVQHKA